MSDPIEIDEKTCDNCGYQTNILNYTKKYNGEEYNFCDVCSGTFFSAATMYSSQISDDRLYKSIAYCVNMILDEIRELGGKIQK